MDAAAWDTRYAASPDLAWGAEPNRWVAADLGDLAAGRALDLGAGEGRNAVWLAERGWTVTAVDFSAAGLEKGRRLADTRMVDQPLRIEWVLADATTYSASTGSFDLVLLAYLHLPPDGWRAALRRGAEALAPGGILLVIGHDSTNITEGVGGPQDPAVLFTPDDVVGALADMTDVVVERAQRRLRPVVTAEGGRDAIDAVVRLRKTAAS